MSESHDVAISGFGPVGATLAVFLGRSGLRVAVLERKRSVYHSPRAASMDAEAMRIFQAIGVAGAIVPTTSVASGMRFVNADGKLLMYRPRGGESPEGWPAAYRFHQPALENIVRDAVAALPNVRVHLGAEVEHVSQSHAGARHRVRRWNDIRRALGRGLRWRALDGAAGHRRELARAWPARTLDGARHPAQAGLRECGGSWRLGAALQSGAARDLCPDGGGAAAIA